MIISLNINDNNGPPRPSIDSLCFSENKSIPNATVHTMFGDPLQLPR